jgi:hypothetical protein
MTSYTAHHGSLTSVDCIPPGAWQRAASDPLRLHFRSVEAAQTEDRPAGCVTRSVGSSIEGLTWGTCYGDGPEAIRTEHGIGLVDWGGVLHGPLLWDVAQWMRYIVHEEDRQRYLSAYRARTSLPRDELTHLGKFTRLCHAHELRFKAFRVLHADHDADSRENDAEAMVSLALSLGVQLSDSAAD